MREYAIVESVTKDFAKVIVKRESSCGEACANCASKCNMKNNSVEVKNPIGAKVGDKVLIELSTKNVILSAFLVYIMPLIMLVIGYVIFTAFGFQEIPAILFGFLLLAITFLALHFLDKKNKDKFVTTIVEILGE